MYCNKCAVKVLDDDIFCFNCGNQLKDKIVQTSRVNNVTKKKHVCACFHTFAILGLAIGIVSFVYMCLYHLAYNGELSEIISVNVINLFSGINGLVFAILGIRSNLHKGKAITGLCFSSVVILYSFAFLIM